MADLSTQEWRNLKRFDAALAMRQFEIDLYWKKSLFFWGFIGAAFVAVAAIEGKSRILSILVSGFGMVCSLGWMLVNRAGKYWQEQWESKIEAVEDSVTGPLFKDLMPAQDKGWWLSGRRYSVSKLAIAISDYVFLVWVAVFLRQAWLAFGGASVGHFHLVALILICVLPLFYLGFLGGFGRSTPRLQ
jgi:hypothetical protein